MPYSHNAKNMACYHVVTITTQCLILMLTRCRSVILTRCRVTTLTQCRVMLSGWHIVTMSCCHGVVLPQSEQGSSLEDIVITQYITYCRQVIYSAKVNKKIICDTNYARH